ncbi:MAG TPA: hypothetical protein VFK86_03680 [Bauldia sp.]|nr:hypothetical protein [Bauldia sp.]
MAGDDAVRIYGTDEATPEPIRLSAGPLSVEVEGGAVRYVRYAGHEAIRGIDYLVRDSSWRTPPARLVLIRREETADMFLLVLDGTVEQDDIDFRFRLSVEGHKDGRLEVRADGEAHSGFLTNRTGFVVLHPILGVAGKPVTVTHKDGSTSEAVFPELISPDQPILDIRALRHEVAPGLFVTCRMEAALPQDPETIFEMEDQRNWTDASYKTYVGSLLDPWPYRIEAGTRVTQRVTLVFEGTAAPVADANGARVSVRFGDGEAGRVPEIGLGLMPQHRSAAGAAGNPALTLRPQFITVYAEIGAPDFAAALADYARIAEALGAAVQLELVLPQGKSPGPELAAAADACAKAGLKPARVIACPAPYLKSVQPVGPWPEVVDLAHIYNQARKAFPQAAILGGMLSYFTELNRKRPPVATIDGVTCTTTPIVHAADDRSVIETCEAIPAVAASMAAIAPGKPLHVGPSSIGMRHNPYGASTAPNPEGKRIAMAEDDPRQKGLYAAAWTVGYAAAIADTAVATLALNHLAGPQGVAGPDGRLYPVFHVMAALTEAGSKPCLPLKIDGSGVAALAWRDGGDRRLILANQSGAPVDVALPPGLKGLLLDEGAFEAAATDTAWRSRGGEALGATVSVAPYAVLFARG